MPINIDHVQWLVRNWVVRCFGSEQADSGKVRGLRLLEEAIEFAQAVDVPKEQVLKLVEYVYLRPVGDPLQELGGVGITYLAAASALRQSVSVAIATELQRILDKPVDHFAKRNQMKLDAGFV